jgi:hypothetical protein
MAGETVARATIVLYDGAEQAFAEEVAVLLEIRNRYGRPASLLTQPGRSVDPHEEKEQGRTAQSFVVPPPSCSQSGSHRSSPR